MPKRWRHVANEFDQEDGAEPSASLLPTWAAFLIFLGGMSFFFFGLGTCLG